MAHHDHQRLETDEVVLEPVHGVHVEVVGGLVEQQDVGLAEERLGQQRAHLLAAGELLHALVVQRLVDAQAGEQRADLGLRLVAVEIGEGRLELGGAVAVGFGEVGLGVDRLARLEHLEQLGVALHHGVDGRALIVGELVLLQRRQAQPGGDVHVAVRGLEIAAEHLEQRRLAGAVGADQAVAMAGQELDVDVLEEGFACEVDRDV